VKFEPTQLVENATALIRHITDSKPSSIKGEFVRSITLSSTMGPGIRVAV
jgi:large subunit ribosomal protein L1